MVVLPAYTLFPLYLPDLADDTLGEQLLVDEEAQDQELPVDF